MFWKDDKYITDFELNDRAHFLKLLFYRLVWAWHIARIVETIVP
jgi:hypothetical protein